MISFTYDSYIGLLRLLKDEQYRFDSYEEVDLPGKAVIMRHDIDNSLEKAARMSHVETAEFGDELKSVYFLLISSDFYNVFSLKNLKFIERIIQDGHEIGLHFDEMRYPEHIGNTEVLSGFVKNEADILSKCIGLPVTKVSMHRPSKGLLEADLLIPGMINTYSSRYFNEVKYLSDSRRNWREPVEKIIKSGEYSKLQILVHPFWYEEKESDMKETITSFINSAVVERYDSFDENFTDLVAVLRRPV